MSEKVIHEIKIIETEDGFRIELTGDKEQLRQMLFEQGRPFSMPFGRGRHFGGRGFGGHGPFGHHHHERHEHGQPGWHEHDPREHMRPPFEVPVPPPDHEEAQNQHYFFRRFGGGRGGWKAKRGGYDLGPWWDESTATDDAPPTQV
jgi:hypothetical protein